jgi:hypothetical protein
MKEIILDIPITLILPGVGITMTALTIPITTPPSKENTGLILPDDASTMTVLSVKLIGMEGTDLIETMKNDGEGLFPSPLSFLAWAGKCPLWDGNGISRHPL